jgi:hypothetical protein
VNEAPIYQIGGGDPAEQQRKQLLAEIEKDRLLLSAKRAARQAQHDTAAEVEAAKISLANEVAIDAAESEYGPLEGSTRIAAVYAASGRVVIVKRPHRAVFHRFQDAQGKVTTKRVQELVCGNSGASSNLVHPTPADFDSWLNEEPALLGRVAHHLAILAGVREEEIQGK